MHRIQLFLADVRALHRSGGWRPGLRLLRKRLYSATDNLLYEYYATGVPHILPDGWNVRVFRSQADPGLDLLRRSGGDFLPRALLRGAVAWVVCIGDEPVGHRYEFPYSTLARHMGPGTTYFGNAFVRPEWRGQGVSGHLLRAMAATLPAGTRILLEVPHGNTTSQRSLARNGATLLGRLRTMEILARLVRVRLDPAQG
jgi:ribosomal protein S18 acetylase RimI-like enzyme